MEHLNSTRVSIYTLASARVCDVVLVQPHVDEEKPVFCCRRVSFTVQFVVHNLTFHISASTARTQVQIRERQSSAELELYGKSHTGACNFGFFFLSAPPLLFLLHVDT